MVDNKGEKIMFVIKNVKYSYNAYLNEKGEWKGLLSAKTFSTREEAEANLPENGEVLAWNEVVGLKK